MRMTETCQVAGCGKTRSEHGDLKHKFSTTGELEMVESSGPRAARGNSQRSKGSVRPGILGDPVVRFLLVQKKIISADELEEAEKMLRASGMLHT